MRDPLSFNCFDRDFNFSSQKALFFNEITRVQGTKRLSL
jgi:hypothetical protein